MIGEPYLWKWKPESPEESAKPSDTLSVMIFNGLTLDQLDDLIDDDATILKVRKEALMNYEKYEKMIDKLDEIRERKRQAKLYRDQLKDYRPFQKSLTDILNTQDDRNIHVHSDPGKTGKKLVVGS